MKYFSSGTFALAFVVSAGALFAADPPPWAYGFEGPPQGGGYTHATGSGQYRSDHVQPAGCHREILPCADR